MPAHHAQESGRRDDVGCRGSGRHAGSPVVPSELAERQSSIRGSSRSARTIWATWSVPCGMASWMPCPSPSSTAPVCRCHRRDGVTSIAVLSTGNRHRIAHRGDRSRGQRRGASTIICPIRTRSLLRSCAIGPPRESASRRRYQQEDGCGMMGRGTIQPMRLATAGSKGPSGVSDSGTSRGDWM